MMMNYTKIIKQSYTLVPR